MVKPERFGHLHLVYHFTVPLRPHNGNFWTLRTIYHNLQRI